ncbi:MAG: dephospho-CoA kinase [Candidatus Dormibacteria bacterium]
MAEHRFDPSVVALTGGIASGKSTVAGMFSELGAAVVDADLLARQVVAAGTPGLDEVVREFGPQIVGENGELDRSQLGGIVFQDPRARARLETIIHPKVAERSQMEISKALAAGAPLIVYEIPLLFETGRESDFAGSILVHLDPELQLERLVARSGLDRQAALDRIGAQMPLPAKRARATWVIDNSGPLAATRAAVVDLWRRELHPIAPA